MHSGAEVLTRITNTTSKKKTTGIIDNDCRIELSRKMVSSCSILHCKNDIVNVTGNR